MSITSKLINLRTYTEIEKFLGNKTTKIVCYATIAEKLSPGLFGIRYHSTIIYTIDLAGNRTFFTHNSPTTNKRLNSLIGEGYFNTKKYKLFYNNTPLQESVTYHLKPFPDYSPPTLA